MRVLFLSEAEVTRLLSVATLLDALEAGFRALSAGEVSMPPRTAARSGEGLLGSMSAFVPSGAAGLGVKLVSVFAGNEERGQPSHQALISLFDPETGSPLAVMDGTYVTAVRTAASAAVSVKLLSRPESRILAIVGAGVQGRSHLAVMPAVRDFDEIRIASRTRAHAEALARDHPAASAVPDFAAAVSGADVVCACTDSSEPVVLREWVAPGTHVTSVGSAFSGAELDPALVRHSRLFVESRIAFEPAPAGANELGGLAPESATEIGEVVLGVREGRRDAEEITVYKSMGVAMEDVVAARLVYDAALRQGVGTEVSL